MVSRMAGWKTAACLLLYAFTFMQAGEGAALRLGCALPTADEGMARTRLQSTCKAMGTGHIKDVASRVMLGQSGDTDVSMGRNFGPVIGSIRRRVTSPHMRMQMSIDPAARPGRDDEGGRGGYPEGCTTFIAECKMPTDRGMYRLRSYRYKGAKMVWRNGERVLEWTEMEPVVMVAGDLRGKKGAVVRVHDQCFTSEVLGSKRCDCKEQLDLALTFIQKHGGAIIYMPQEGRGIGLANKIAAYELQDGGLDTVDANRHLGFDDDERSYDCVPDILADMEISSVELVTNNPFKVRLLTDLGVKIERTRPSLVAPNTFNAKYLRTKASRMAHSLNFDEEAPHTAVKLFGPDSVRGAAAELSRGRPVAMLDGDTAYLLIGAAQAQAGALAFAARFTTGVTTVALEPVRGAEVAKRWTQRGLSEQVHAALLTAEKRASLVRQLVDTSVAPADLTLASDVHPVAAAEGASDAAAVALHLSRLGQAADGKPVDLGVQGIGGGFGAAMAPLLSADGWLGMGGEELYRFATQHAIALTSSADILAFIGADVSEKPSA
jgi:GTP cyclohydrolase II